MGPLQELPGAIAALAGDDTTVGFAAVKPAGPECRPPDRPSRPLRIVHLGKYYCMDHEQGRATRLERDVEVEVVRLRRSANWYKIDHYPDPSRSI